MRAEDRLREIEKARRRIEESHVALARAMTVLREGLEHRLGRAVLAFRIVHRPVELARDHPRATLVIAVVTVFAAASLLAARRNPSPPRRIPSRL